jgi:hypothetical protein
MTSDPTPYGELNSVLHELLSNIRVALGESLAGVYPAGFVRARRRSTAIAMSTSSSAHAG